MAFGISLFICCVNLFPLVVSHYDKSYSESPFSPKKLDVVPPASYSQFVLPKVLKPISYDLTLKPDLKNRKFEGTAVITFDVLVETSAIVMNGYLNTIPPWNWKVSIASTVQSDVSYQYFITDSGHDLFILPLYTPLQVQKNVKLTFSYVGILTYDMVGFYISTYNTSTANHKKISYQKHSAEGLKYTALKVKGVVDKSKLTAMAITQFDSTDARRAFPCFDEPEYRVPITIKIYRMPTQNSISNMPLVSSSDLDPATN